MLTLERSKGAKTIHPARELHSGAGRARYPVTWKHPERQAYGPPTSWTWPLFYLTEDTFAGILNIHLIGQSISLVNVLERPGEEGMGVVCEAEAARLDGVVALKFLPDRLHASHMSRPRCGEANPARPNSGP